MRLNLQANQDEQDRQAALTDNVLAAFKNATPTQIENWIDNNVTTLAQARTVLKALAKVVALLVRRGTL